MCTTAIFSPPLKLTPLLHAAPTSSTNLTDEKRYVHSSHFFVYNCRFGGSSPTSLCMSVLSTQLSTCSCNSLSVFPSKWLNLAGEALQGSLQIGNFFKSLNLIIMQGLVCLHIWCSAWISGRHSSKSTLQLNSHHAPSINIINMVNIVNRIFIHCPSWFNIFKLISTLQCLRAIA